MALGSQSAAEPVAVRAPGPGRQTAKHWARDGDPIDKAMEGEVFHGGSVLKPGRRVHDAPAWAAVKIDQDGGLVAREQAL
eukprot:4738493-Pyramimonas_sp.AAC.1